VRLALSAAVWPGSRFQKRSRIHNRLTIDNLGTGGMVVHSVATGNAAPRWSSPLLPPRTTPSYQQVPENSRYFERQSVPVGL